MKTASVQESSRHIEFKGEGSRLAAVIVSSEHHTVHRFMIRRSPFWHSYDRMFIRITVDPLHGIANMDGQSKWCEPIRIRHFHRVGYCLVGPQERCRTE